MAKKKMSKKTKYTLLGISLVAVGVGYFIAKHFKSSVAGIGAVTKKKNKPFFYEVVKSERPLPGGIFYIVNIVTPKGAFPLFGAATIDEATKRTIRDLGEKPMINID